MTHVEKHHALTSSERFAALSRIGAALIRERDEKRLLHLIAQTAVELTGAEIAAFTLRPISEQGELLVPSEGNLFHLAVVIGVMPEHEELFRHMPLGGEGLLAPIFHHGISVRVKDVLETPHLHTRDYNKHQVAKHATSAYAEKQIEADDLSSVGLPPGHPPLRSFLGAPLLGSDTEVRGGLLLGHSEPDCFGQDEEDILVGLATQAAVAIENARLYRIMQIRTQELDAIFESIADGIILTTPQGEILRENACAKQLRERMMTAPDGGKQALEQFLYAPARMALTGQIENNHSFATCIEKHDTREYTINASPLYQRSLRAQEEISLNQQKQIRQAVTGTVIVWHDVTEARRLELAQRIHAETETQRILLQHILDNLPSSVYLVHGPDARLLLANRVSKTVWGAEWQQEQPMADFLLSNTISIYDENGSQLPLEDLSTIRAVRFGETSYQRQEVIHHPDESSLPVIVNTTILDGMNIPTHPLALIAGTHPAPEHIALVVHQDVSALKEAEQIKDDFIGIAAHELRNPLAALHGFVDILITQSARGKGGELVGWQQEALQGIAQSTRRLMDLTEDLLDVTRLQAGQLELRPEPTDLIALMKRVVQRHQTLNKTYRLHTNKQSAFLVVSIDVQRIEQVVNNILTNAIKYSPAGSTIEITLWEDKDTHNALFSVKDMGIGIPEQQQGRIFGRFVRADNAQKQGITGTGLGLFLSRELVERHGGRIWFSSVENHGSTFFVSLPLMDLPENDSGDIYLTRD